MSQAIRAFWPIDRGVQTLKEIIFLNMRTAAAAAGLSKLWSDTFLTNAGIDAAKSSNYTYRGSSNYDVILNTTQADQTPTMTSETAPSGNVYKSSQSGGNNAWQCFDKNIATYWESLASSLPTWIAYKFTSAKILSRYTVTVRSVAARAPKTFKLQGSNDSTNGADGTWEDLDTRLDENTWGSGEKRTYDFVNATAYSMYRLYITANNGDTYMEITEIELMNAPATQADIVSIRALNLADNVDQIMLFAEVTVGSGTAGYYVSTDDGISWAEVELDKLVSVPAGQQLRIKVELTGDAELDYWGIAA